MIEWFQEIFLYNPEKPMLFSSLFFWGFFAITLFGSLNSIDEKCCLPMHSPSQREIAIDYFGTKFFRLSTT